MADGLAVRLFHGCFVGLIMLFRSLAVCLLLIFAAGFSHWFEHAGDELAIVLPDTSLTQREVPATTEETLVVNELPTQIEYTNIDAESLDMLPETAVAISTPITTSGLLSDFETLFKQTHSICFELGMTERWSETERLYRGASELERSAEDHEKNIEIESSEAGNLSTANSGHLSVNHESEGIVYGGVMSHPAMYVACHNLRYYRNLMKCNSAPAPAELAGMWRGVNVGVATLAIDRQFIKEFYYVNGCLFGDNVSVCQVSDCALLEHGWQPIIDVCTGSWERQGRFAVECPQGRGRFSHGLVLNYAAAGNGRDPARRIWDQLVKLDDNHMLGRATVRVGLAKVPVAYFVLERISVAASEKTPTPVDLPVLKVSAER